MCLKIGYNRNWLITSACTYLQNEIILRLYHSTSYVIRGAWYSSTYISILFARIVNFYQVKRWINVTKNMNKIWSFFLSCNSLISVGMQHAREGKSKGLIYTFLTHRGSLEREVDKRMIADCRYNSLTIFLKVIACEMHFPWGSNNIPTMGNKRNQVQ